MLKITNPDLIAENTNYNNLLVNEDKSNELTKKIEFTEDLPKTFNESPFEFELIESVSANPKVTMSIDLTEYINAFIQHIKNIKCETSRQTFNNLFLNIKKYLKEIYSSVYLSRLLQILFKNDERQIEIVKDTFVFHYLSALFNELLKNTIDERIQKYFSLKEFLSIEMDKKIIASLEFSISYEEGNIICFEFFDKYSRGFPSELLSRINILENREEYLSKRLTNRHYKQQTFLAVALLSVLDEIEINLLKNLLPKLVLPNNQMLRDVLNYKDIIFVNNEEQLFISTLTESLISVNLEEVNMILFKLKEYHNTSRALFGGEGCGLRQIAEVFFKHADLESSGGFSSFGPSFRIRKHTREPIFSSMKINNEPSGGAKLCFMTSSESYGDTKSNPPSLPMSPGIKLLPMLKKQEFQINTNKHLKQLGSPAFRELLSHFICSRKNSNLKSVPVVSEESFSFEYK